MAKRRMLNKYELLRNYALTKHLEKCQVGASFSVSCLINNWVLWKHFDFYPKILSEYNLKTREKWDAFQEEKIEEYNQKLDEVAKFRIEYVKKNNSRKNANTYFQKLNKFMDESNDKINAEFQKYMICSMLALIDMGYGKIRLNRLNDLVIELFDECTVGKRSTMDLRKEMEDYGLVIEWPFDGAMNFDEVWDSKQMEKKCLPEFVKTIKNN